MKCRSLVAAVVAIAVSSFGVIGFAADVNTTTTYNTDSNKIEVASSVSGAVIDSEITYIVKSSGKVVYIDQDTAENGGVSFNYKIDKGKIADDYSTSVKFGSSAIEETFSGVGVENLGIMSLQKADSSANYSIVYPGGEEAWGIGEKVTATVVANDGYEVTAIYVNGNAVESVNNTIEILYGQSITADVKEVVVEAGLSYILLDLETDADNLKSRIAILKPQGSVDKIGVVYKNDFYASAVNEMSAVKIIFPANELEENCILTGAYMVAGDDEIKYGTEEQETVPEQ